MIVVGRLRNEVDSHGARTPRRKASSRRHKIFAGIVGVMSGASVNTVVCQSTGPYRVASGTSHWSGSLLEAYRI